MQNKEYWKSNIRTVVFLLSIWFLVGYVASIFLIEPLNKIRLGNLGLGFWSAQQGAIFAFVFIVLAYAIRMDRLDKKHDLGDEE